MSRSLKQCAGMALAMTCGALTPQVSSAAARMAAIDFSACANANNVSGATVGFSTGNGVGSDAKLRFKLLDPALGNNTWLAGSGARLNITLSAPTAETVAMLLNSGWGQAGVVNATVKLTGTGGASQTVKLVGNSTIRDWNNWVWTNTIDGKKAQEWWTSNPNPTPQDQSKRLDAHVFHLNSSFAGQTLTGISVISTPDGAPNYMEPLVWAISVGYPGASGTLTSHCVQRGG